MFNEKGYLYIAAGQQHIEEAFASVESLRKVHQEAHVTLISDREVEGSAFDHIHFLQYKYQGEKSFKTGNLFKLLGLIHSPYEQTFYVDTDVHFCENCEELFVLLNYFDLLLSQAPGDNTDVYKGDKIVDGYMTYNTGIMVFNNNEKVVDFFEEWIEIFKNRFNFYPYGQPAFMEALLKYDIKIYVLRSIYNLRLPYFDLLPAKKVKIIHGRAENYEEIEEEVNRKLENRIWHPVFRKTIAKGDSYKEKLYMRLPSWMIKSYKGIKSIFRSINNDYLK